MYYISSGEAEENQNICRVIGILADITSVYLHNGEAYEISHLSPGH
jgi:hypothetical protein